jgi:SAM-dependent methyltransferase
VQAASTGAEEDNLLPVQADADAWPFAASAFDLVVQVDFLDRSLFAPLRDSLCRGGLLLIDTFLDQGRRNLEGPSRPDFLLAAGELPRAFADFELLRYDERRGDSARATLLARKR